MHCSFVCITFEWNFTCSIHFKSGPHFNNRRMKMETRTNVKSIDNDEALQIIGGDGYDFVSGLLCGLSMFLGL